MSQRENVNPRREQDHRKTAEDIRKERQREGGATRFLSWRSCCCLFLRWFFFVSKLSKIEKTKLDMDKIEVNEDISQESQKL